MSRAPTVVWQNGELVPFETASVPLEDRGLQFGESLYEVIPVTAGRARALPAHGARMRAGADRIGLGTAPSDEEWETIVAALTKADPIDSALLYAQLTGGSAPRSHLPAQRPATTFFAYLRAHTYPGPEAVRAGITAVTTPDLRWAHCDIKTTMLLPAVLAKAEAKRRGADEAIFVSEDGQMREGSSSNAFIVEDGVVVGVPQTSHILPGITRTLMEQACSGTNTELRAEPISVDRMMSADELFITSTSRLVMPVLSVDDRSIAGGSAGPVAEKLAAQMRRDFELD
jgi:D-alanine transaminase